MSQTDGHPLKTASLMNILNSLLTSLEGGKYSQSVQKIETTKIYLILPKNFSFGQKSRILYMGEILESKEI